MRTQDKQIFENISFYKYQSLGNDFILVDWFKDFLQHDSLLTTPEWHRLMQRWCDRHRGIGADGVLVLLPYQDEQPPTVVIFNADGSAGHVCLNGLRCVALHLVQHHGYVQSLSVRMHTRDILCELAQSPARFAPFDPSTSSGRAGLRANGHAKQNNDTNNINNTLIITHIGAPYSIAPLSILINELGELTGYNVDMGNPHFIIHQKTTLPFLMQYGSHIEHHAIFPQKTNVGYLWPATESIDHTPTYHLLVHERGCGITQSCSSAAAAAVATLYHIKSIQLQEQITIIMPGGSLHTWIESSGTIMQKAPAHFVFSGLSAIL